MNNLFLRLYLLIVSTVLVVGLGLDFAWQHLEKDKDLNDNNQTILNIVSLQLETLNANQLEDQLLQVNSHFDGNFSLIPYNNPLVQSIAEELNSNQTVLIQSNNELLGFKQITQHKQVLQLRLSISGAPAYLKSLFIILFYGLIALGIFYWIWPLSKDLNQLEAAVNRFDQQQWNSKVELPVSSSISHLANAYNALLDKIKRLVETQQAMSHSISHELRTPLARIRFSLQMAEESQDITIIKDQIGSITDDISEMNRLINELLNFASLENTSSIAKMEKVNIDMLIENLLDRLRNNAGDKKITFSPKSTSNKVLCDSYLMERALQNLIVNACKFSKKNILITTQETILAFEILVEDDGAGVAEDSKYKIFDSFVQLNHQHKNKGFGLGLAIVRKVMVLHNGSAMVEKSSLGGAKFILSWPKS